MYDLITHLKPKLIVELGTYKGFSLFSFAQAIKNNQLKTELHAVDTWKGDEHSGFYGEYLYLEFIKNSKKYFRNIDLTVHRNTFDDALSQFKDDSIDILHIDGLHTYKAVKHDFKNWLPKINKNIGIIILHDISEKHNDFGVYKLWKEIQKEYNTISFEHSHGLGVVFFNENLYKRIFSKIKPFKEHYLFMANKQLKDSITKPSLNNEESHTEKSVKHETKIYRLCRNQETINKLKKQQKQFKLLDSKYFTGIDLFSFINKIINESKEDYALLCHEDVILPQNIDTQIKKCIQRADEHIGPDNWGIIGNAGIELLTKKTLLYLKDPSIKIISPYSDNPQIVESIDGNTMLLNLKNIKRKKILLPTNLSGYHLYDLILCLEVAKRGLICAVSSDLYVTHLSCGDRIGFIKAAKEQQFQNYFKKHFANKEITTINGNLIIRTTKDNLHNQKIEEIIERNLFNTFQYNKYNLNLLIKYNTNSNKIFRLLDSISMFQNELNPNVKLSIHITSNLFQKTRFLLFLKTLKTKYAELNIIPAYSIKFGNQLETLIKNVKDEDNSFVFLLDYDTFLISNFAKYIQYLFSNSKVIVGDVVLFSEKWNPKSRKPVSSKLYGKIMASNTDYIFSQEQILPLNSVIYSLELFKKILKENIKPNESIERYSFLLSSLKYETYKTYPLPFIGIPKKIKTDRISDVYRNTTILSQQISNKIMSDNYFRFYSRKNVELENLIRSSNGEFEAFKQGLIWKTLEKYRKFKKLIKNILNI